MPISDDVLLVHGDCFDVLPKIPEGSVDMVFCDLPYGVTANAFDLGLHGKKNDSLSFDKKNFPTSIALLWREMLRIGKRSCPFLFTGQQPFTSFLVCSNTKAFKYAMVWDKMRPSRWLRAKYMPLSRHEDVLVFYRKTPTYSPQMTKRDEVFKYGRINKKGRNYADVSQESNKHISRMRPMKIYTHMHPTTIIRDCKRDHKPIHPTQKPVALMEWLIKTYTNPGDLVLDPCSGSGTTAIAALNTGRRAICIEKDAGYHAAAVKRLAEARQAPAQSSLPLLAKNS